MFQDSTGDEDGEAEVEAIEAVIEEGFGVGLGTAPTVLAGGGFFYSCGHSVPHSRICASSRGRGRGF